jgi:moderate conductance mechanosensitive channel
MTKAMPLLIVAVLAVIATIVASAVSAKDSPQTASSGITLPEKHDEVAPFLAQLDDKQARSILAKVLEERTKPAAAEKLDLLAAARQATSRIAARIDELASARTEAALAPTVFWRWVTSDGSDPGAPFRVVVSALAVLAVCWAMQAAAASGLRRAFARRAGNGLPPSARRIEVTLLVRWVAFLGALTMAQALVPGAGKPPHQVGLAVLLAFACAWITAGASTIVLPALHGAYRQPSIARGRTWLEIAAGLFFTCFFGISLLREAGVSDDARLLIALPLWFVVGTFVIMFLPSDQPAAANDPDNGAALDPIERYLALHSWTLLKLCGAALLLIAGAKAIVTGPAALWQGLASFGLLALLVAALGLTRLQPAESTNPFAGSIRKEVLRRAMRIVALAVFVLALARIWQVDPLATANAQFGEHLGWGLVVTASTIVITYWLWQLVRGILDQSALGPPVKIARGEEGEQAIATRLQTVGPVLRNFLFVALVAIATLVCLASLGVNITPILAGMGVIGIALGFGSQTLVRDIISGVFFLAEDAFRIGEYIQVGNTRGTVEAIAIRSVRLRHHRGPVHTLPFGEMKQLTNYSRDWIMMKLEFLLAFGTDLQKVKRLVKKVGQELHEHPHLGPALLEPVKSQGVRRMEPTGIVVGIKFMATPGSEVYLLRREIYQRLLVAFEKNGIEFARPQVLVASSGADLEPSDTLAAAAAPAVRAPKPV